MVAQDKGRVAYGSGRLATVGTAEPIMGLRIFTCFLALACKMVMASEPQWLLGHAANVNYTLAAVRDAGPGDSVRIMAWRIGWDATMYPGGMTLIELLIEAVVVRHVKLNVIVGEWNGWTSTSVPNAILSLPWMYARGSISRPYPVYVCEPLNRACRRELGRDCCLDHRFSSRWLLRFLHTKTIGIYHRGQWTCAAHSGDIRPVELETRLNAGVVVDGSSCEEIDKTFVGIWNSYSYGGSPIERRYAVNQTAWEAPQRVSLLQTIPADEMRALGAARTSDLPERGVSSADAWRPFERLYDRAQHNISIYDQFFEYRSHVWPPLLRACRRNVSLRLITNAKASTSGRRKHVEELRDVCGERLEYIELHQEKSGPDTECFIHAKFHIVDDRHVLTGSHALGRSHFDLDFDVSVMVADVDRHSIQAIHQLVESARPACEVAEPREACRGAIPCIVDFVRDIPIQIYFITFSDSSASFGHTLFYAVIIFPLWSLFGHPWALILVLFLLGFLVIKKCLLPACRRLVALCKHACGQLCRCLKLRILTKEGQAVRLLAAMAESCNELPIAAQDVAPPVSAQDTLLAYCYARHQEEV